MKQRRDEIEEFAVACGEPTTALIRSALRCQEAGDLAASARISADQVVKRPATRWTALLLALEATELRFMGAVKLSTPQHRYEGFPKVEKWTPFTLTTFPEKVHVQLQVDMRGGTWRLRSKEAKDAATYDPLVKEAIRELAEQLAEHLGATVAIERA